MIEIVRYQNHSDPVVDHATYGGQNGVRLTDSQRGRRLIHQHQSWGAPESPCYRDGLPLPAGQPLDGCRGIGNSRADAFEQKPRLMGHPAAVHPTYRPEAPPGYLGVQKNVAGNVQLITEIEVLSYGRDARLAGISHRPVGHPDALCTNLADIGDESTAHDPDECRFPRAVVAHKAQTLPRPYGQAHRLECSNPLEELRDPTHLHDGGLVSRGIHHRVGSFGSATGLSAPRRSIR